jgi:hypothetical protein
MLRKLAFWSAAIFVSFASAVAIADLSVIDGLGAPKTIKNFVCETTKLCNATVLIKSDGTEISVSTSAKQDAEAILIGPVTETAPASDVASSGLNGRLQRVAQRLSSLIAQIPASLGQTTKSGSISVTVASDDDLQGKVGSLTETAPASDTASSGLNGRLQRIAQRVSSLIALLPTSLGTGGGLKVDGSGTALPVSAADGANVAVGTRTDTACALPTSSTACNEIQLLKAIADLGNTPAQLKVNTTGGATPTGNIAPNNTTAVVVKASAGTLYGAQLAGLGSAPAYLKIYNATSATCGSGTPVKRLMIPAASTAANGAGSNVTFGPMGVAFGTGITYCVTTGIADNDATAPAASTFLVNLDWN